jgi:hypothetical protein
LIKLNDSISVIGCDTLKLNPWLQGGNRFGTIGTFGTLDDNPIDYYTNNTFRGRWATTGNLIIGSAGDEGYKFQVKGTGGIFINPNLSREGDRIRIGTNINGTDGQNILMSTSNDYGASYKNVLVERDGNVGLGHSAPYGWRVGAPLIRCHNEGLLSIVTPEIYYGNTGGPWNASALVTSVSSVSEWLTGQTEYPRDANHYYFGTRLTGNFDGAKRAPLHISGRELIFKTGATEATAVKIAENRNVMIGTETDNGDRFHVVGNSTLSGNMLVEGTFYQAAPQTAVFGNALAFDSPGGVSRISSYRGILYQGFNSGDQHYFKNEVGGLFDGTMVTFDPGYYPTDLKDSQVVLKVLTYLRTPGLIVNMAGRVGVGTIDPTAQLHATGSVRFAGLTNDNSQARVVVCDANGNLYYRDASSLALNETMYSDLAVNGRVSAQRMLITQTGRWPDYVFSKQYKLPSLTEVENFINQNNHLPGIPSADEVQKKGIDVGSNQAALLKKIEELMLYVIEQDKKLKQQSDEITELKKTNKDVELLKQQLSELKSLIIANK